MALKLTLKPGERVAINGAVIVNGDKRTSFLVESKANVLREADIMQPEEATTPARRIYLPIVMMALAGDPHREYLREFEMRLKEFANAVTDRRALELCLKISARVANNDYYKALASCRQLIEFETDRLSHAA
ncbi:MAG: flagellar biosynthesis repressor FlbT [Pseudomonadota bacterium]